jgi:DNA-binding transcriptional MerR regulator
VNPQQARSFGYRTAGEVAELLGVTPRTIHYYEEEGLVTPKRTDKGTRFYSEFDVERLEVCVRLASIGTPVKKLRQLALTRPASASGREASHALAEVFDQMRRNIRSRLSLLRYLSTDLDKTERLVRTCWECPNRPNRTDCPDCPCELELDKGFLLHLTWDPDRPEPLPVADGNQKRRDRELQKSDVYVRINPRRGSSRQ